MKKTIDSFKNYLPFHIPSGLDCTSDVFNFDNVGEKLLCVRRISNLSQSPLNLFLVFASPNSWFDFSSSHNFYSRYPSQSFRIIWGSLGFHGLAVVGTSSLTWANASSIGNFFLMSLCTSSINCLICFCFNLLHL